MEHTVREHSLSSGARLLSIQIPNTTTYYWSSSFCAGYRFVDPKLFELPHLAEHLAFEGTKLYPDSLVFKAEVERDGTYYNATTSFNTVSYIYSGIKSGLGRIIPINMSQIYEPLYEEASVKQEQNVIVQEMSRRKEDDGWRAWYVGTQALLPDRNLDIEDRIARIPTITRDDLVKYHTDCYGAANTDFIVAGDYSDGEIDGFISLLEDATKKHGGAARKLVSPSPMTLPAGRVFALEPYRKNQSQMSLRFAVAEWQEEHFAPLRIISVLLTGGLSASLLRKAREAGLTYGVHAGATIDVDMTAMSISSQTDIEKLQPLIELSLQEVAAIVKDEYSDEQLERAIGYTTGSIARSNQTPAQYAGWYDYRFVEGRRMMSPEDLIQKLRSVDRKAIHATAKLFLQHQHAMLGIVGADLPKHISSYEALLKQYLA